MSDDDRRDRPPRGACIYGACRNICRVLLISGRFVCGRTRP